eukprot:gene7974-16322_t
MGSAASVDGENKYIEKESESDSESESESGETKLVDKSSETDQKIKENEKPMRSQEDKKILNAALYGGSIDADDAQESKLKEDRPRSSTTTSAVTEKGPPLSHRSDASENLEAKPSPISKNQMVSFNSFSTETAVTQMMKPKKRVQAKSPSLGEENTSLDDDNDADPMEILFQFIPYYGQGDSANDSTVRATLKSLLVDDIDSRDENGNTLLLLACQYRCEDLVRIMLNKGADPNAFNDSGACCLHFACYKDSSSKSIAKALLQNGANPEVKESSYGCTPLHYCASIGDLDFCKMLISYGGLVSTRDYYNYTCVDYAREAGHALIARYLQDALLRSNIGGNKSGVVSGGGGGIIVPSVMRKKDEWIAQEDPETASRYYYNPVTGECLWEDDYLSKMQLQGSSPSEFITQPSISRMTDNLEEKRGPMEKMQSPDSKSSGPGPAPGSGMGSDADSLVVKTSRIRLQAFLEKNAPDRLNEVEALMSEYKGKEKDMLLKLCKKYNVPPEKEFLAFSDTLSKLEIQSKTTTVITNVPIGITIPKPTDDGGRRSGGPTPMAEAVKRRLSSKMNFIPISPGLGGDDTTSDVLRAQLAEMKLKYESQLAEERSKSQSAISEQEGAYAKLESMHGSLQREKESLEVELRNSNQSLERLSEERMKSGNALEVEVVSLQNMLNHANAELSSVQSQLAAESEKLRSLENSLAMMTAGDGERVAAERRAAEARATEQQVRDKNHAEEIAVIQDKATKAAAKLKQEMAEMRSAAEGTERDLRVKHDEIRRSKEQEIESLNRTMADYKQKMTKDLSAAQQIADAAQRKCDDMEKRLEEQQDAELAEARPLIALNAQLFRDLGREQAARKKLHNEMEDLKGKIRVYVRIRPMSTSEIERRCEDAVIKDGKMSVMVKGVGAADAKKIYDFDQTFGGDEGNTQVDVFKDTKHLVMSVIDGYNVCIFAYGQTGSGKTYTMMGSADIANCVSADGTFEASAGVLPRAVAELFRLLNEREAQLEATVEVQMFQLYRDGLEDLLRGGMQVASRRKKKASSDDEAGPSLRIVLAEHSPSGLVEVEGAEKIMAENAAEVMKIVAFGSSRRTTASTNMNSESSRSHLICVLVVRLTNRRTKTTTIGKLTLVDLAGSERVDKSGAQGEVLKEAQSINKSLSALGGVIAALTSGNTHIPYRDHALTMLMSDSIGGNAKTLMFVN